MTESSVMGMIFEELFKIVSNQIPFLLNQTKDNLLYTINDFPAETYDSLVAGQNDMIAVMLAVYGVLLIVDLHEVTPSVFKTKYGGPLAMITVLISAPLFKLNGIVYNRIFSSELAWYPNELSTESIQLALETTTQIYVGPGLLSIVVFTAIPGILLLTVLSITRLYLITISFLLGPALLSTVFLRENSIITSIKSSLAKTGMITVGSLITIYGMFHFVSSPYIEFGDPKILFILCITPYVAYLVTETVIKANSLLEEYTQPRLPQPEKSN